MENASKALIIAGAILLSILIIALGMRIYNSSNSSAANADLSATEIASFNSSFESYDGKQKGTAIRSLITAVNSSNATNQDDRKITLTGVTSASDVISNKTYTVTLTYDSDSGLITTIKIDS